MAFTIARGRPLERELHRLVIQEIASAVSCLTQPPREDGSHGIHQARKHVKKARAALQLSRSAIGAHYRTADEMLRIANRALGPWSDVYRMTHTLERVETHDAAAAGLTRTINLRLAARRSALEKPSERRHIQARVVRLLASTLSNLEAVKAVELDPAAVAAEVRRAHARARQSHREALRRPRVAVLHQWRRRVKREWHLLRLISELVGDRLSDEQHQLQALDGHLGDLHDVIVLIARIAADSPLPRRQTAHVIRVLRTRARDLLRRSQAASLVLNEPPRDLERRIVALWGLPPRSKMLQKGDTCRRRA